MHPLDCKYFIISENADCIDNLYGEGGRGGSVVKEGARVKRAIVPQLSKCLKSEAVWGVLTDQMI